MLLKFSIILILLFNISSPLLVGFIKLDRFVTFQETEQCQDTWSNRKFAIIIHGWRESCSVQWALKLKENLEKHRGGCIICMDYRLLASFPHYFMLAMHSHDISKVLLRKLYQLECRGFDPNQGFIFGFSLGGRIALEAGKMFGTQRIAEIDTCDMAGPGFDKFRTSFDPKQSAKNVQCIHTSEDKGTTQRNCHQNWNMGFCGHRQLAASDPPLGSHGLCPEFYNSAFENDFYAEENPQQCNDAKIARRHWPNNFKMGYMENRKPYVNGVFYASTSKFFPFTRESDERMNFLRSQSSRSLFNDHTYRLFMIINNHLGYSRTRRATIEECTNSTIICIK